MSETFAQINISSAPVNIRVPDVSYNPLSLPPPPPATELMQTELHHIQTLTVMSEVVQERDGGGAAARLGVRGQNLPVLGSLAAVSTRTSSERCRNAGRPRPNRRTTGTISSTRLETSCFSRLVEIHWWIQTHRNMSVLGV